jgi:LPXTG-site transpeptidase (sortase) family protein
MLEMTNGAAGAVARVIRAVSQVSTRKFAYLVAFLVAFALSFALLSSLGLTPDPLPASASVGVELAASPAAAIAPAAPVVSAAVPELPVKIAIPAISLTATVADPTTTDTQTLDADLLHGAVRYPTSAELGQAGNVVIFGHSSYLPVVRNQAYKTFDGIQRLAPGDLITVYSSGTAYTYAVRTVAKESASSGAGIPLDVSGKVLTLATCNSFATKDDRFVVTADFVESHPLTTP